jgi:8-oxo-dGTP diphosphatase
MGAKKIDPEQQFLAAYDRGDFAAPLVTVDMAIFAIMGQALHVLLIERENFPAQCQLALPGGFIDQEADTDMAQCAHRKLFEKTGIRSPYLEQVHTIGNAKRDPRGWSVTVLYFALIDATLLSVPTAHTERVRWTPIDQALTTPLAFDHAKLLHGALERLRKKTHYTALPVRLMTSHFTLSELQCVFEIVLGHALEKKSFRRRMLDCGILAEVGQLRSTSTRPAALYKALKPVAQDFVFARALADQA